MAVRHVNVVERVFGLSNRCAAGDADALGAVSYTHLTLPTN